MSTTMKVRVRIAALFAAAAFGAAACGDSGSTTEPALQTKLQLTNNSNVPIVEVVYAECTDEDWGPERLGAGETIAPGATRTWNIQPGCWDVAASTDSKTGYWWDKQVEAGGTITIALSSAANEAAGPLEFNAKIR